MGSETIKSVVNPIVPIAEQEWSEILSLFEPYFLNKNDHLIQEGVVCNHIYFVETGALRMYYLENEKDITRFFTFEHRFASALTSFLTRQPSLENIQALEDTKLLRLNYTHLQYLYEKYPAWQKFGRLTLENAYVISTRRIEHFIRYDATHRYLKMLEDYPDIFKRVPLHHIATYLGIIPESLSRIRKKISKAVIS